MYQEMAHDATKYRIENKTKLRWRFDAYRLACMALGASVLLWIIDLN
jgi:hypothetical protein